ncbi:MAG: methionyl-tRNA formyltransferase [Candidatus Vogelbacteria bacterium]|nr:methionyl-tRNA formyltransferase [Candidatus Vogelbacteria bacterium]
MNKRYPMYPINKLKIVFLGTPEFSVDVLKELELDGIVPDLIVTNPDEPKGRKLVVTPPPVKIWAQEKNITVIQPENLQLKATQSEVEEIKNQLSGFDLFIVVAYGKIIPESILNLPRRGTLNVHPSLLPKYRGPSPIQAAILNGDKEMGISIMLLDKEMDHGPIIAQEKIDLSNWHPYIDELRTQVAKTAGQMLARIIPDWISGDISAIPQNHTLATFTKKFDKESGLINAKALLNPNQLNPKEREEIWRRIRALNPDPGVYTIIRLSNKNIRIKITHATMEDGQLVIEKIIPEGKKEMLWEDWKRGNIK